MSFRQNPPAFTLIELPVVFAIIAMPAALLFVGVRGMIDKGDQTKCAGNLKQIRTALSQAMAENELKVPFSIADRFKSYSGSGEIWYATIAPYLAVPTHITDEAVWNAPRPPGVFACPSSKAKISTAANQVTDYGYIELHFPNSSGTYRGDRLSKIAEPSKILILADTQKFSGPSSVARRDLAPHDITDPNSGMGTRPSGKANVLFPDAQVEEIKPADLTEASLKTPDSPFQ